MKAFRLSLAALVAALIPTSQASAAGGTATCQGSWSISMSPGISMSPATSTVTTNGQTGTITCSGTAGGHAINGPGTLGIDGSLEGTCLSGTGALTISITVPTSEGPVSRNFPAVLKYTGTVGTKTSDAFEGPLMWAAIPTSGTCVTTPLTQILQIGRFTLKG
jgi:hypothetical protein